MALKTERGTPTPLLEEEQVSKLEHAPKGAGQPQQQGKYTTSLTFLAACLGACASACATNPADIIKVRQQLLRDSSSSFLVIGRDMARSEGVLSLWNGVTASCLREASYGTIRMGSYDYFKLLWSPISGVDTFSSKLLSGVTSGAVGALIASPCDLVKVQMQAARPTGRPPYANTFAAFAGIYQAAGSGVDGIKGLWRGVGPTVLRAAVLTSTQVGCYDEVKAQIKTAELLNEGIGLHFGASMIAGFIASAASQPIDVVKVRIMHDRKRGAAREFSGALSCAAAVLAKEGPMGFYKGFGMCWMRLGAHTVISLVLFERFRALFGIKPL